MELFTFLVMGGVSENIELLVLAADDEHRTKLEADFTHFDASRASCFLPADTEKLLGTIEGGFGGLERFSAHVNEILGELISRAENQRNSEQEGQGTGPGGGRSFFRRTLTETSSMNASPAGLPLPASFKGSSGEKDPSAPRGKQTRQTFSGTFGANFRRAGSSTPSPSPSPPKEHRSLQPPV